MPDPTNLDSKIFKTPLTYDGLTAFAKAYLGCALWTATYELGEELSGFTLYDFSTASLEKASKECAKFAEQNSTLLSRAWKLSGYSRESAGHDFWLTRNHHGSGFWDRRLGGTLGEQLTTQAHLWGEQELVAGDDGQLYLEGGNEL